MKKPKQELTPWFPAHTKPVRVGVYQVSDSYGHYWYCLWDGSSWSIARNTVRTAYRSDHIRSLYQNREWRGHTTDQRKHVTK